MVWCKAENGELLYGDTLAGPGFSRGNSAAGGSVDGWSWYGNLTAAYAALGIARKVKGPDRAALDDAIDKVMGSQLKAALIALRDDDPDP
jgi:hypothetical protein